MKKISTPQASSPLPSTDAINRVSAHSLLPDYTNNYGYATLREQKSNMIPIVLEIFNYQSG
ncbi:hypothetical protein [Nostoc sp.]